VPAVEYRGGKGVVELGQRSRSPRAILLMRAALCLPVSGESVSPAWLIRFNSVSWRGPCATLPGSGNRQLREGQGGDIGLCDSYARLHPWDAFVRGVGEDKLAEAPCNSVLTGGLALGGFVLHENSGYGFGL